MNYSEVAISGKPEIVVQELDQLAARFEALSIQLVNVAYELRALGLPPAQSVIDALAHAVEDFQTLRAQILENARSLSLCSNNESAYAELSLDQLRGLAQRTLSAKLPSPTGARENLQPES